MKTETIYEPGKKKGTRVRRIRQHDIHSFAFNSTLLSVSLIVNEKTTPSPLLIDMDPNDALEVGKRLVQQAEEFLAERKKNRAEDPS